MKINSLCFICLFFISRAVCAQNVSADSPYNKENKNEKTVMVSDELKFEYNGTLYEKRTDKAMKKWRSDRFGQFFHFGLY